MKVRRLLIVLCALLASGITAFFLCGFVPEVWACDLLNQFQLFYAVALLTLFLALLLLRARVLAALCFVSFVAVVFPLLSMFTPGNCITLPSGQLKTLTVLNFNTEFQHNNNYQPFKKLIHERNPDLIALVEVDQKWIDALSDETKPYAYTKIALEGAGLAVFSKYPLEKIEVRHFGRSHHPRISAVLKVDDRRINLLVVHPTTPQSESGFHERNAELSLFGDEVAACDSASLLVGDMNCGPWGLALNKMLKKAALLDSEQGFGPQPSWPARVDRVFQYLPLPPLIPIDHVFVSKGICVLERTVGPAMGSDHMPVFVRVSVPENAKAAP